MSEKKHEILPGVGCDVTNCKFNTVDCRCSAGTIRVRGEELFCFRGRAPPVVVVALENDLPSGQGVEEQKILQRPVQIHSPAEVAADHAEVVVMKF